jgi:hypothetical protein
MLSRVLPEKALPEASEREAVAIQFLKNFFENTTITFKL